MMEYKYSIKTRDGVKTIIETDCPTSYFLPLLNCVERIPDGNMSRLFELVRGLGFNIELFEPDVAIEYTVRF